MCAISQNGVNENLYKNFNKWTVSAKEHKLSISAFITVKKFKKKLNLHEIELEKRTTKRKELDSIKDYTTIYQYKIYLKSNSVLNNDTTGTWIYGVKIYINGEEIIKNEGSGGLVVAVEPKPTLVYKYLTTSSKKPKFYIEWDKAIHGNSFANEE